MGTLGNALFVVWRESFEAFLVIGILSAWLNANQNGAQGRRALWGGVVAGLLLALLLGWLLLAVQDELSGQVLEAFQTAMLLVACGLITQMVLWMHRHGRQLKARMHADLHSARLRSGWIGIAGVAALAVAREGAETVIFLYGLASSGDVSALIWGAAGGLLAAGLTAWLTFSGLARLNIKLMLQVSALMLLVLASALLASAADRLIGAGWLPALLDPVWDVSQWIDDAQGSGKLLADFTGLRSQPSLSTLLLWGAYWCLVWWYYHKDQKDQMPNPDLIPHPAQNKDKSKNR